MAGLKKLGDEGELEVVSLVPCPNCGRKLMVLPPSYPLYDVQCTACLFRAQVKTSNSHSNKKEIFGATWEIMDKYMKAGSIIPPMIANFKWKSGDVAHQEIIFFPFVPRAHLRKRFTTIKKSGRQLWMFNYVSLDKLPRVILYRR